MKIDPNDPRLTAYALGELAETERAAFETLLADDPDARQEVERIRRASTTLSEQLAAEPCPRLEPEQRLAIHERVDTGSAKKEGFNWKALWLPVGFAVVVGVLCAQFFPSMRSGERKTAESSTLQTARLHPSAASPQTLGQSPIADMNPSPVRSKVENSISVAPLSTEEHGTVVASSITIANGGIVTNVGALSFFGGNASSVEFGTSNSALIVDIDGVAKAVGNDQLVITSAGGALAATVGGMGDVTAPPIVGRLSRDKNDSSETKHAAISGGNVLFNEGHVTAGSVSNGGIVTGFSTAVGVDGSGFARNETSFDALSQSQDAQVRDKSTYANQLTLNSPAPLNSPVEAPATAGNEVKVAITTASGVMTKETSAQSPQSTLSIGGIAGALTVIGGTLRTDNGGSLPSGSVNGWNTGGGAAVFVGGVWTNAATLTVGSGATAIAGLGVQRGPSHSQQAADTGVDLDGQYTWDVAGFNGEMDQKASPNALHPDVQRRKYFQPTPPSSGPGEESYAPVTDNPFRIVTQQPLSTFGLDVDTASYANIRRFLTQGQLPPRDAVRIEEMLNYFPYDYPAPKGNDPFALYVEMGECPWNPAHQLALIGLKAKDVKPRQQPPLNLVFLLDISGSMADNNKLPLIKQALHLLVEQLDGRDRVSLVVYANNSRVLLSSTRGDNHQAILAAIDELYADGGTNGGEGIQSAYREAINHFIEGGINRVILCTDGDFNVGITDPTELSRLIEDRAKSGVFLNVYGFGMGNVKDSTMEKLAASGRGQYAYIDGMDEARKNLVDQVRSSLLTVAKDTKLQVEFNPALVQAYRLIGYENRVMQARDFNNDHKTVGAASVGATHNITALYEIVPADGDALPSSVDPLKYQASKRLHPVTAEAGQGFADEWMTIKLRYKEPAGDTSKLLTAAVKDTHLRWRGASDDFRFAAAVADFGMVLRDSPYRAEASFDLAIDLAAEARRHDPSGYRAEFIEMVKRAQVIDRR